METDFNNPIKWRDQPKSANGPSPANPLYTIYKYTCLRNYTDKWDMQKRIEEEQKLFFPSLILLQHE